MYIKRLFKLILSVTLAASATTIQAQYACSGGGTMGTYNKGFYMYPRGHWDYPNVPVSYYYEPPSFSVPSIKWPTVDIREGKPVVVTNEDIVYSGYSDRGAPINFSNFEYSYVKRNIYRKGVFLGEMPPLEWDASWDPGTYYGNPRTIVNPPRWISGSIWGYRVKHKSNGSLVPDSWGGFMDYPWDGQSQRCDSIFTYINLNLLSENEIYFELLNQSGGVVGRFDVVIEGECGSCKTLTCSRDPKLGSVDYSIPVGLSSPFRGLAAQAVRLDFYQNQTTLEGAKSIRLVAPSNSPSVEPVYGASGVLQSVRVGDRFAKIEQLGGGGQPVSLKVTISSDYLNPAATVIRTVLISNKLNEDQDTCLEFNNQVGGVSSMTSYWKNGAGAWVMETGNGLRRETRSTTKTATLQTVRTKIEERMASMPVEYAVVSDVLTRSELSSFGWQEVASVQDPDGAAQTTTTSYYGPAEDSSLDGSGSHEGNGRVKQVIHPTGESERHYYLKYPEGDFFDSAEVVKRAFAGTQEARETTTEAFSGISSVTGLPITVSRVTEKVNGQIVSKKETLHEARGNGIGNFTEERVYSANNTFISTYTFRGNDDSVTVVNPDGTASKASKVTDGQSGFTTSTTITGYVINNPAVSTPQIQTVTLTEEITDNYGEVTATSTYRFKDGEQILTSRKLATAFDGNHKATRFEHFVEGNPNPVFVTEKEYACCGVARERDESGVDTYYAYDALHRVILTNRNGITTETVRQGLTTSTHRYPQAVATGGYLVPLGVAPPANEISRTVTNLVGDGNEEWSRSAQDGSMVVTTTNTTYNLGNGIGRRVVTHPPVTADDGADVPEQINDSYLDGTSATTTGNLGPDQINHYSTNALGMVTQTALLDGTTEKEITASQQDWAGHQVKTTYASDADGVGGNDFSSSFYNSKGQLTKSIDPDGLTRLYGYNLRGEQTFTATDLNGNGVIDLAVDQVSFSETDLATRPGGEWVMRTTQKVWLDAASDTGTAVSYSDVSLDALKRWSIQNPSVQPHESTSVTTLGAAGSRSELSTRPDGISQTTTTTNSQVTNVTTRDSNGILLYQTDMTYDSLNRPFIQTDSRTGPSTRYYINSATDIVNRTLDHLSRETLFTYDHRGRAKSTNLPDTLNESGGTIANVSTTFYFPDGTVREQSGDGGYRTTQTYDYAGRPATLTTYGTETAVTRWLYDPNRGLLTGKLYNSPTPGSGQGPSYTYTPGARLKTRTQARLVSGNPLVTTYAYGTASGSTPASLDQVTHSDGTPAFTVSTRDRLGRPLSVLDPAAGNRSLKYTRHGALEEDSITSGILVGQKLLQDFDSRLRPRSHTASFGAQALGETIYQYGPSGAVRSVSGNGNTASYSYHPQKRTLENVTYTKDGQADPILQSTRKHDAANRLTRITAHVNDGGVQKPIDHHAYDYDALDHIQKHTGITGAFWKYGYNATGEVTGATRKMPDATTDYFGRNYRYHYDGIGNRTSVEQSRNGAQASRLFSYTPNALNQYSSITHPDFVDVSGTANPLAAVTVNGIAAARQSDYFYKELSEDNSAGPQWIDATITDGTTTTNGSLSLPAIATNLIHDDDGNLTSDGEWIYAWDAENRLIGIERSAAALAAGAPYHREKHDYDHRSRRIRTTLFTNSGTTPSGQTLYIFDGWKCVAELTGTGQPVRKYTWGLDLSGSIGDSSTGNVGALLCLVDSASNKTHIHLYDKNGNVSGLVDATTRKRSASYEYDAFGQLTVFYGDYAKKNPFTFSTKYTDFATGLCYYGYRWYSPMHGRWPSRDPIGENGGVNLYGFLGNSTINEIDLLGHFYETKEERERREEAENIANQRKVDQENRRKRRDNAECCTQEKRIAGRKNLQEKYYKIKETLRNNGIIARGTYFFENDGASCDEQNSQVMASMSPIPDCWECKYVYASKYSGGTADHWWVECKSFNEHGNDFETIVFDAYHDRPGGPNPQLNRTTYPYEQPVSDADWYTGHPEYKNPTGCKNNRR
jgi:RHS repeat-associated protein